MSHPVIVLQTKEKVGKIVDILKAESHNGFPVVQDYTPASYKVGLQEKRSANLLTFLKQNLCKPRDAKQ